MAIASDPYHRGAQQPVLVLVSALQFVEDMVIRNLGRIHHFDGLVNPRIESLPIAGIGCTPIFCSAS